MSESAWVLDAICSSLLELDPDIRGSVERQADKVVLMDSRLELHVRVQNDPDIHSSLARCHMIARLCPLAEELEACVVGIHSDREQALVEVAKSWRSLVAPPVLSLFHARPVLGAMYFAGTEAWGVAGCHGFAGPMRLRFLPRRRRWEQNSTCSDYAPL